MQEIWRAEYANRVKDDDSHILKLRKAAAVAARRALNKVQYCDSAEEAARYFAEANSIIDVGM